jgi:hypothetical protein
MLVLTKWIGICSCFCICCAMGPAAQAGPTEQAFAKQFGAKVAEVKRTQTYADDIVVAQEMIDAADGIRRDIALVRLLCHESFKLASTTPRGYSVAIRAMMLLEKKDRPTRIETLKKVVPIQMRMFRNATTKRKPAMGKVLITNHLAIADAVEQEDDLVRALTHISAAASVARTIKSSRAEELNKRVKALAVRRLTHDKVRQLKTALKLNPKNDRAATQLVRAYVVDLDQPEKARLYAFLLPDGDLKKNVELINKPAGQLTIGEVGSLAHWYHDLGRAQTQGYRYVMFDRAKQYYELLMERDKGEGLQRRLAGLAHAEITAALAQAGYKPKRR